MECVSITGEFTANVTLNKTSTSSVVYIANMDHNLLGINFMESLGLLDTLLNSVCNLVARSSKRTTPSSVPRSSLGATPASMRKSSPRITPASALKSSPIATLTSAPRSSKRTDPVFARNYQPGNPS